MIAFKPYELYSFYRIGVMFKVKEGSVFVNNAMVSTADIKTSNGVIHVIDTVIIPN